jgi:thiol-disulfide isomerase/thioredoxin
MDVAVKTIISACFLITLVARADEHLDVLTIGGDTYSNVTVTKVTATDIYFFHARGMGNAKLKDLDPKWQSHFSYNPTNAAAVEQAQAQANSMYHEQVQHAPPPNLPVETPRDDGASVPAGLEVGQKFPDFNVADGAGGNFSLGLYKGKVVLIDFWATWFPACREEMTNVAALYQSYHPQGLEIIGVSLDTNQTALVSFTQQTGMPWPECFDGKGWENQLALRYGINAIPMSFLLDRNGIIIGKDLRGARLPAALQQAFAQ